MANITQLYQQLQEGKGTKSDFVKAAVSQYPNYVSVLNSFNDVVRILKSKSLISESHKLTTAQIIDRLNPYTFKKGVEVEIEKAGGIENCDLEKIREKVAKALTKNPNCYDAYQFANATEMNKRNSKHQYQPVKNELKDKENQMRKPKGFSPDKANTKASKKENRKGKPKGVKIMKEDVTQQAGGNIPQEENLVNKQVILKQHPDKQKREGENPQSIPATVVEQNGNIIHVQLEEDGKVYATTRSVIDTDGETPQDQDTPYTKDQLKQAWLNRDKEGHKVFRGMLPYTPGKLNISNDESPNLEERENGKLKEIVGKLKDYLKKKKSKKGIKDEAMDYVTGTSPSGEEVVLGKYKSGRGQKAASEFRSKGATSAQSKTIA